ncbi:MAG: sulfotransferase family 2 domain-containing protein [Sphingobacteriales bacterium]|jgi:hypothetical protein
MPVAVINKHNVLYIHIPKTGGSSIERYLSMHGSLQLTGSVRIHGLSYCGQHLHAKALNSIKAADGHDWIFTIVRHPVARLISEYRYQMRKPGWLRSRLSFSSWLTCALARRAIYPWYRANHFRPQHEFILPGTEIMRFEDGIDACLQRIAKKLEIPEPTTSIREKSSSIQIPIMLTPSILARIKQAYAGDYMDFGYSNDVPALLEAGIKPDMLMDEQHAKR